MNETDSHKNLLFETSPFGNVDAIVEHDGRAIYFYLNAHDPQGTRFPTKACWVRNLVPGPLVINRKEMEQGIPPLLPRTHCRHPHSQPLPSPDTLDVVWFEEGNAAALCENDQVLAVIPPWSGTEGFHGYATDCVAESPICWPMPAGASDPLLRRIDEARSFWNSFQSGDTDPFKKLQQEILESYESRFGKLDSYFAIDGNSFPPRGLARYRKNGRLVFLTVAMSLCPQPNVELFVDQPGWYRRIEMGLQVPDSISETQIATLQTRLSSIAGFPWRKMTWLGQGHSINFMTGETLGDQPADFALAMTEAFIRDSSQDISQAGEPESAPPITLPQFRNDPVNLIWLLPISEPVRDKLQSNTLLPEQVLLDTDFIRW